MVEELQNYFANGKCNYPASTTEAYNLLVNYKTSSNRVTILVDDSEEVLLSNIGGSKENSNLYKISGYGG